jgi:hypothetical protein
MIFKVGLTYEERVRRRTERKNRMIAWSKWFAWYPVNVGEEKGKYVLAWGQWVERSAKFYPSSFSGENHYWNYRRREQK